MQRDLVERRRWLSRQDFLDGVALGQAMPGPLAAQALYTAHVGRFLPGLGKHRDQAAGVRTLNISIAAGSFARSPGYRGADAVRRCAARLRTGPMVTSVARAAKPYVRLDRVAMAATSSGPPASPSSRPSSAEPMV